MKNLIKHLKTIAKHRRYVRKMCFKMGIPWQGLIHDLSKYNINELKIAKYYDGTRSPHEVARETIGYSPNWMNHYHKNKHHWQYWLDMEEWPNRVIPIKMPYKYVIEMFCDFVGAGKAYMGKKWTCKAPLQYWRDKCAGTRLMHPKSMKLLVELLIIMNDFGEKEFVKWYRINKKGLKKNYGQTE